MPHGTRRWPLIAVTPGEPGGVGPEITAHLFSRFAPKGASALIVGAYSVLEPWFERYGGVPYVIRPPRRLALGTALARALEVLASVSGARGMPRVLVLDTGCRERYAAGRDSAGGGRHSGLALGIACRLASEGLVDGIVTGPISKHSLHLAGYAFSGHTEFLSRHFHAPHCQMMMVYGGFRVVPLTRHLPLERVSRELTKQKIVAGLRVVDRALIRDFGVRRPRLAVAGLNPHAGEEGVLGDDERRVIIPALRRARREGIRVAGPVPADALFQQAGSGTVDAFIAMYHDQGLIPFKMVSKRRGVNVTVGLPVVRTSVDHGVAYDIAGRGVAGFASLREAFRLAEAIVRRRKKQAG